jgi:O-antigen ligase
MQQLVQGQGIIDIVNGYLYQTLRYGLVGVVLFLGFNIAAVYNLVKTIPSRTKDPEMYRAGLLIAVLILALLLMIAGTSYISLIPQYHMILVGLAVAYARVMKSGTEDGYPVAARDGDTLPAAGVDMSVS